SRLPSRARRAPSTRSPSPPSPPAPSARRRRSPGCWARASSRCSSTRAPRRACTSASSTTTRSCSRSSTSGPRSAWCDCSRGGPAGASARSSSRPAGGRAARVSWRRRSPRRKHGVRSGSGPHNTGEERELRDSAEMFEAALAQNPADLTMLEALREIYTRLGDVERLMETAERIEQVDPDQGTSGRRRRRGAAPADPAPPAPIAPAARAPAPPPRAPTITPPPFVPAPSTPVRLATAMSSASVLGFEPMGGGRSAGAPSGRKRMNRARIGELLVAEGVISQDQLHEALREHRRSKERLGSVLARRGLVTEERLVEVLSKEHGLPSVDVRQQPVPAEILALVPGHLARKYEVLPLSRVDGALTLAMSDPTNVVDMDEIAATTRLTVLPVVAVGAAIRAAIETHYAKPVITSGMDDVLSELTDATVEVVSDEDSRSTGEVVELRDAADGAPVVKFVNKVMLDAI